MITFWRRTFFHPARPVPAPTVRPAAAAAVDDDAAWAAKWAERERRRERAEAELARNPGFAEILAGIEQERRNHE